jgi:hypothetical protein
MVMDEGATETDLESKAQEEMKNIQAHNFMIQVARYS